MKVELTKKQLGFLQHCIDTVRSDYESASGYEDEDMYRSVSKILDKTLGVRPVKCPKCKKEF